MNTLTPDSPQEKFDHVSPPTHEEEQAKQPDLGKPKKEKTKATKEPKAKKTKREAKPKAKKEPKVKAEKKTKTPKKAPKAPKRDPKVTQLRGMPLDGSPRKAPGTNPPRSDEAGVYGRKIAKARKAKELSQRDLAAKVELSQPGLANIERGVGGAGEDTKKGRETRRKLEKALGLKITGPEKDYEK